MRSCAFAAAVLTGIAFAAPTALAQASAQRGAALYESRCGACHSPQADRVGPRHQGVVGRKAGGVSGYDYSPALRSSRLVWDVKLLERWLTDPEAVIPGQRMGYRLDNAAERVDIVAFLATLK